jgi:hypothetical protein
MTDLNCAMLELVASKVGKMQWEYYQIIYDPLTKQINIRPGKEEEKKEILTDATLFEIINDLGQSGWEAFSQIRTSDNQFEMWLKRQQRPADEAKAIEFILSPEIAEYIAEKEPKILEDIQERVKIEDSNG